MSTTSLPSILAISGSLRSHSSTQMLLAHIESMVAAKVRLTIYTGLAELPHFDDREDTPASVEAFRKLVREADGILICTPEYAFGVPGSLKNALDWTVGTGEFVDKPVALITASSSGQHAHAALSLILSALSVHLLEEHCLLLPFIRAKLGKDGEWKDLEAQGLVATLVDSFVAALSSEHYSFHVPNSPAS